MLTDIYKGFTGGFTGGAMGVLQVCYMGVNWKVQ